MIELLEMPTAIMAPREGGNPTLILISQIVLFIVIIYWLLIRPQKKERERHEEMVQSLKKGDEVVTSGGIIGKIIHAEPDRLTIKTAENTRVVVERSKVGRRIDPEAEREKVAAGGRGRS